jgi:transketolase
MRNAFIQELVAAATHRPEVFLIVGDLGYSVVEPFADRFPDRFLNAGVAEQNMMGLAAGMASEGFHVFVYSIGNFPTFRCAEQLRNDVDYHRLPVTVVAVGGGLAYGNLGYSHHTVQDYALIRAMPNVLIASPGDPNEVRACVRYLCDHPQPSYLRLGKAGEPNFHATVPEVDPGRWVRVAPARRQDSGKVLLSTGTALEQAMALAASDGYADHSVWTLPLWGSAFKRAQPAQLGRVRAVMTLEDHLHDGGFGSWMLEAASADGAPPGLVSCRALDPRVCGTVGSQSMLNAYGGLSVA